MAATGYDADTSREAAPVEAASREAVPHCPYCALQCGMTLRSGADGTVEVAPRDFPTNRGGLCQKGWTAAELLDHPERLASPLVRDVKGGPLRPAGWDEAYARVADGIRRAREAAGPDAVAVYGGGGLTNGAPRHAELFASGLSTEALIPLVDRFLIFYIRTADRLQRTASWIEAMDGGLAYPRSVIVDDALGIATDLDDAMARHIGSYADEWKSTVDDPERMRPFVSFPVRCRDGQVEVGERG